MRIDEIEPFAERLGRTALQEVQLRRFQLMLDPVLAGNPFQGERLRAVGLESPADLRSLDDLGKLPLTTKAELVDDQARHGPYGTNLTYGRQRYTRIHQTSGTTGEPLRCLDTEESWDWWRRCWTSVYTAAGVTAVDRIFFAFSFGPFIGFWSGFEAAQSIGALAVPGGGMTSVQRLRAILANDISVLVCTPTYALHLAEVAETEGVDLATSGVRVTVHAGEPGAGIPGTRARIEQAWSARAYDHAGATEVGAWGFECQAQAGLHVNELEFVAEVIDPVTEQPAEEGELVLTNLGRWGMPVIRYRTGDRVHRSASPCGCGRTYTLLEGGVEGRIDDALIVRGVNVFPSAIENLVRRFPEVGEFAVTVRRVGELDELELRVEVRTGDPDEIAGAVGRELQNTLGLRPSVTNVPMGTLPRFDLKARRFTDHRTRR